MLIIQDKILKILSSPINLLEIVCLLSAVFIYTKEKSTFMLINIIVLACTVFIETGNKFGIFYTKFGNNWIYNLHCFIEMPLYCLIYYTSVQNKKYKQFIWIGCLTFILLHILNILFYQGFYYLASYSYIVGCIVMAISVFLFFNDIISHIETVKQPITSMRMFWFSIGIFVFFSGQVFLMSFFQYFLVEKKFYEYVEVWKILIFIINIILYSCLTISFFKRHKVA